MENVENKSWPVFVVLGLIGFSFWWMGKSWNTEATVASGEMSYEMPRPKDSELDYDLSGRRVVYSLKELEKKEAAKNLNVGKVPVTPSIDPKKNAAAKKADPKKNAQQNKSKKKLGVYADGSGHSDWSVDDSVKSSEQIKEIQSNQNVNAKKPNPTPAVAKQDTLTASQWKALLFNSPSQSNAYKFYKAFHSNEVSQADFYDISEDLLADASSERQSAALALFRLDFSVKSFSIMVKHYTDQTPDSLKSQIYSVMKMYGELSHFGILSRLLYVSDARVVAMATQVLTSTVSAQNAGAQGGSRPPASAPIAAQNFKTFLPALQRLSQSDNATIAAQAQALLQSIQTLLTA